MATLEAYRSKFRLLSKQEIIAERRELFQIINGDAFFPLKFWPEEYQRMFWAKPIGDKETFKLMMFCLGNGCAPHLISQWIILSQSWLPTKAEKRTRQLDFILNNADVKRHTLVLLWFGSQQMASPERTAQREIRIQVKRQELEQIERYGRQFSRTT